MQTVETCNDIHNLICPDCWAIRLCLWEGWANGQLRNSSQKVAKPQLNLPIKKVNCSLKTISTINYYFTRSFWTHRVLNTVPFQHSGYVFFCLCNLVYEHLFTMTVELFLLRNIGRVCQRLVGHNQGDGNWSNKSAHCFPCASVLHSCCYTIVIGAKLHSDHLARYPNFAEQMPANHHQPIRYCKVTHAHAYTHVDIHAPRLHTCKLYFAAQIRMCPLNLLAFTLFDL